MTNALEQIKQYTTVVADTGDFQQLAQYKPQDATTNPSLILKAVQQDAYKPLLEKIVREHAKQPVDTIIDRLLIAFGIEILNIIPGRVSTEVDARLSFDTQGSIDKARTLIAYYEAANISRERVLIKLASTWEGVKAAEVLQKEGVNCNMTLLFSLVQAMACAQVGAKLISPFVGRVYDWYKKRAGGSWDEARNSGAHDPGVQSVRRIYTHYKALGYSTEVMAASFRSISQITELVGCDLLTINTELLQTLQSSHATIERRLFPSPNEAIIEPLVADEASFRYQLNDDAMATEKLAEGIQAFVADTLKLEHLIHALRF